MTNEKYGIEILQIFEALDMSISVPALKDSHMIINK